jgi:hypothetical protein
MATADLWTYRDATWRGGALVGLTVEAVDGEIGKVDDATDDAHGSVMVVDTGSWIFGKKVLLPAGVVDRIDLDDEKVYVNRTKAEIEGAPEYDEDRRDDTAYRAELTGYYGNRS